MSNLRLGIDVDGVLANFIEAYERLWIKHACGKNLFPANTPPPVWDWPQYYGYDQALVTPIWNEIKTSASFWEQLRPYPYAAPFLKSLETVASELYFITDRPGINTQSQTQRWLTASCGFEGASVIVSPNKGVVCAALGITAYLDDKAENIENVLKLSPETRAFIFDAPYNRHLPLDGATRITSVWEFMVAMFQAAEKTV